ncbi:6-phosphogluconate dehydrogenase, NAD-binding protein [alpha proteobacterium BAL199]|jgi:L-threonate 2-dehydrogenase|nr:6-phosphogluconate dehydrogenase, NAD-binding protein [alpha proteobacterium BAL199]
MTTATTTVGVIGLGSMGLGVAKTLCRAGFETWGFDVRDASVLELEQAGGHGASSPADLGRKVDVAIVLVATADQVRTVLFGEAGAAGTMHEGAVVIASATVPASAAIETGFQLSEHRILMIDGPVSGGVVGAESGNLSLMASGPDEAFVAAQSVLDAIASKVYRLGTAHGVGSTVKTINQLLAGVHIAASAEAMALGIRAGVDPKTLFEVISNSAGSSWMFNNRVPHILDGDYAPKSAVDIFVKDLGIVLETGKGLTFPLPLTATAHQQFLAASAGGLGRQDDSAVIKVFQKLTGIELPPEKDAS